MNSPMARQGHAIIHLEEESGVLPLIYSVSSYGADYPVDSLVKRLASGDIRIPMFQRGWVWDHRKASRFIDVADHRYFPL
jgi:hypothetical protein